MNTVQLSYRYVRCTTEKRRANTPLRKMDDGPKKNSAVVLGDESKESQCHETCSKERMPIALNLQHYCRKDLARARSLHEESHVILEETREVR